MRIASNVSLLREQSACNTHLFGICLTRAQNTLPSHSNGPRLDDISGSGVTRILLLASEQPGMDRDHPHTRFSVEHMARWLQ